MPLRAAIAAILAAGSLCAADPGLLSLAMPGAKVMAGVNAEQVKASPLGQYLLVQIAPNEADLAKLTDATGFDPRRDIREILFASTGERSGIVLVRGTLDVPRIIEAALGAGMTLESDGGVNVITGKPGHALAFLDSTLAIAGEAAAVRAAIDRRAAPSPIGAELAAQVAQLSGAQDAWFVSLVPPNDLQLHRGAAGNPPPGAFGTLGKVLQASGGVKLGANVVVSVDAISQTDRDAMALAGVIKMFSGMAHSNVPGAQGANIAELLRSLVVSSEGPVTRLSLTIPETQIEQLIEGARPRPRALLSQPMQVR